MITRIKAIENLRKHIWDKLINWANYFGITYSIDWNFNKWWKWLVLEKWAWLENNNKKAPNGLWFELKSVSFNKNKKTWIYKPKETMAITMINEKELLEYSFYKSHLWEKLKSIVFCATSWNEKNDSNSFLLDVTSFDFQENWDLIREIEEDYEFIRRKCKENWFLNLTWSYWKWIQPRTKWSKNSTTRAFYARPKLVKIIFDLDSK